MAYAGRQPTTGFRSTPTKDSFNGDNSTTEFTLSISTRTNDVEVFVENVQQEPVTAYSISGNTLTFTSAPPTGTGNIYVIHRAELVSNGVHTPGANLEGGATTLDSLTVADDIKVETSSGGIYTITGTDTATNRTLTLPDEAGTVLTSGGAIDVDSSAPDDSVAIDSSGNVGIGTSSPNGLLTLDSGAISFYGSISTPAVGASIYRPANNAIAFGTGSTERMRINTDGDVFIGCTSDPSSSVTGTGFVNSGQGRRHLKMGHSDTGNRVIQEFFGSGGRGGLIQCSNSTTTYTTTSDYRLKENVVDMTDAITRVKALSPKRFNFTIDPSNTTVDGFLAHEAATVVPEAVTGTHNEVDDEGNPVYQGIDQAKLVPLLTGALQEAIAKIETLETTVADLQTRVTALEAN